MNEQDGHHLNQHSASFGFSILVVTIGFVTFRIIWYLEYPLWAAIFSGFLSMIVLRVIRGNIVMYQIKRVENDLQRKRVKIPEELEREKEARRKEDLQNMLYEEPNQNVAQAIFFIGVVVFMIWLFIRN